MNRLWGQMLGKLTLAPVLLALTGAASPQPQPDALQAMAGRWVVDLRPSLTDPPYTQPMELAIAPDRTVTGRFYQSDIIAGKAVVARGRTCVAFRTSDGVGVYHSQACLEGTRMVGATWAEQRGFLFPWTAER